MRQINYDFCQQNVFGHWTSYTRFYKYGYIKWRSLYTHIDQLNKDLELLSFNFSYSAILIFTGSACVCAAYFAYSFLHKLHKIWGRHVWRHRLSHWSLFTFVQMLELLHNIFYGLYSNTLVVEYLTRLSLLCMLFCLFMDIPNMF